MWWCFFLQLRVYWVLKPLHNPIKKKIKSFDKSPALEKILQPSCLAQKAFCSDWCSCFVSVPWRPLFISREFSTGRWETRSMELYFWKTLRDHFSPWPVNITDSVISIAVCPCLLALLSHAWRATVYELTANLDGCLFSSMVWMSYSGHETSVCLPEADTVSMDTSVLLLHFTLQFHGLCLKIICFPFSLWSQSAFSPKFSYCKRKSALNVIVTCARRDTSIQYNCESDRLLCAEQSPTSKFLVVPGVFKITTRGFFFIIWEVLNLWIKIAVKSGHIDFSSDTTLSQRDFSDYFPVSRQPCWGER